MANGNAQSQHASSPKPNDPIQAHLATLMSSIKSIGVGSVSRNTKEEWLTKLKIVKDSISSAKQDKLPEGPPSDSAQIDTEEVDFETITSNYEVELALKATRTNEDKRTTRTTSSWFHLSIRNGGLGLKEFRFEIPVMTYKRLSKLRYSNSWIIQDVVSSLWFEAKMLKLEHLLPLYKDNQVRLLSDLEKIKTFKGQSCFGVLGI